MSRKKSRTRYYVDMWMEVIREDIRARGIDKYMIKNNARRGKGYK